MNLLLVDSVDFPFGGAHSVHVSLMIKGLRENNQNACLIIPYGRKRPPIDTSRNKYGHFDGIPFCFVRYSRNIKKGFRFLDILLGVISSSAFIARRRRKKKLDAVVLGGIVDVLRDFPIILTCVILRIPLYFWLVEKASLSEDYCGIAGFLNYKSQQLSEWLLPKFASGVIVISSKLKSHYLEYLPEDKVMINPILVSEDTHKSIDTPFLHSFRATLTDQLKGRHVLVYSGSFGEKDGLFILIEAVSIIVKKYPDTVFIMTGRAGTEIIMKYVRDHIRKFDLERNVSMVGFVNAEELVCYNSLANVLFACRTNSPFANHGFPWKLGEYCMTGRPIVATRVSDIETYFTDGKDIFIVDPDDPAAIAEKVMFIYENFQHAISVAGNGKQTAIMSFGYVEKTFEVAQFIGLNNRASA
jgi:glycosyltransferase involved in cell wall biosynthesis